MEVSGQLHALYLYSSGIRIKLKVKVTFMRESKKTKVNFILKVMLETLEETVNINNIDSRSFSPRWFSMLVSHITILSISTNATETIMELKPSLRNEKPMTSGEL
jgi:hypothetical protein